MQTGYYNKITSDVDRQKIISISLGDPKWFTITKKHKMLMPTYMLLKSFREERINENQYINEFGLMLNKLNPQKIYDELNGMQSDSIICCHCGTNHFCHRHLVASWLQTNLNIIIPEYQLGNVNRSNGRIIPWKVVEQTTMF
jgi:hypothetical protein